MLVLSRKLGEKLLIGDNITVTVFSIGCGKVSLGVEAPKDVKILRQELLPIDSTLEKGKSNAPESKQAEAGNDSAAGKPTDPLYQSQR